MKKHMSRIATEPSLNRKPSDLKAYEQLRFQDEKPSCVIRFQFEENEHKISIFPDSHIQSLGRQFVQSLNLTQQLDSQTIQCFVEQINFQIFERIIEILEQSETQVQKSNFKQLHNIAYQYSNTFQCSRHIKDLRKNSIVNYFITNKFTNQLLPSKGSKQTQVQKTKPKPKYRFRLYQKSQKSIQKKVHKQSQMFKQKVLKQSRECTFHPNTTLSNNATTRRQKSSERKGVSVFDKLYNQASEIKMKKSFKKIKRIDEQESSLLKECSFEPKLNQCSQQIIELKSQLRKNPHNYSQQFISSIRTEYNLSTQKPYKRSEATPTDNAMISNKNKSTNQENIMQILSGFNKTKKDKNNTDKAKFFLEDGKNIKKKALPTKRQRQKQNIKPSPQTVYQRQKSKSKGKQRSNTTLSNHRLDSLFEDSQMNLSFSNLEDLKPVTRRIHTQFFEHDSIEESKSDFLYTKNIQFSKKKEDEDKALQQNESFRRNINMSEAKNRTINTISIPNKPQSKKPVTKVLQNLSKESVRVKKQESQQEILSRICNKLISTLSSQSSNNQQSIQARTIYNSTQIPTSIKTLLRPLCQQLEQMSTSLDHEEFIWSMQNLYRHSLTEKSRQQMVEWSILGDKCQANTHANIIVEDSSQPVVWQPALCQSVSGTVQCNNYIKSQSSIFQIME